MFNYDKTPISPEDNKLRAKNSFKRLLYYKTKQGKNYNIILSYLPDVNYIKKFSGRISKGSLSMRTIKAIKYSGYIEYSRLDGRGIFVLQFKEGNIIRRHIYKYKNSTKLSETNLAFKSASNNIQIKNSSHSTPIASSMGSGMGECEECTPVMIRVCAGELEDEEVEDEDCGDWTDSGNEECTPIECEDEGGDEDPYPPCYPDCDPCEEPDGFYICDPNNPDPENPDPENPNQECIDMYGPGAINSPCGCIRGNTGIWECEDEKITDDLDSFECVKNLINNDLPNLKTSVQNSIMSTFNGTIYNINFIGVEYSNPLLDGKFYVPNINSTNYTIGLDSTLMKNATKEYMIAVIYHEMLHAFLHVEQQRLGSQFGIIYNGIQSVSIDGSIKYTAQDPQHYLMTQFIDDIKDAILSFNPNFPYNEALALAKGGIVPLTQAESLINSNEKTGNTNSHGQKCN